VRRLTLDTADALLARTEIDRAGVIDLGALTQIDPYGLLLVVLVIHHHRERGVELPIHWPRDPSIRRMLESLGLPQGVGRSAGRLRRGDAASYPVARIDRECDVGGVVGAFDRQLLQRYPLTSSSRRRLTNVLIELSQNIPHHSNATGDIADPMGMSAMHDDGAWIHLAVVDKGIGLAGSLRLRPGCGEVSDGTALNRIVFLGMSRHRDPGRGGELRRIADLVRRWEGTLAIRSGDAVLYMDAERGDVYESPAFPGVQIGLRLPRHVLGVEEPSA
jgi:anti-sigma regulatory factor (Ser/Thr protein kinase)